MDMFGQTPEGLDRGVGQNEEAFSDVRCADFGGAEDARLNSETHRLKVSEDCIESETDMAKHVFREQERRAALVEDASYMRPEMPGVVGASSFPRLAKRLTGISCRDDIHLATPSSAIKGGKVRPDRRFIQRLVFHPGHESGRSICVPLNPTNSSVSWYCERQPQFKPSGSGAQGDAIKCFGRYSHIQFP